MDAVADTCLLIDLWREGRRPGAASKFLSRHPDWQIALPWIAKAEFLSGAVWAGHPIAIIAAMIQPFPTLHSNDEIVAQFCANYVVLKRNNSLCGLNDMWIAAAAHVAGCGIITRNARHFETINAATETKTPILNYSSSTLPAL